MHTHNYARPFVSVSKHLKLLALKRHIIELTQRSCSSSSTCWKLTMQWSHFRCLLVGMLLMNKGMQAMEAFLLRWQRPEAAFLTGLEKNRWFSFLWSPLLFLGWINYSSGSPADDAWVFSGYKCWHCLHNWRPVLLSHTKERKNNTCNFLESSLLSSLVVSRKILP